MRTFESHVRAGLHHALLGEAGSRRAPGRTAEAGPSAASMGVDPRSADSAGRSPMHLAAQAGRAADLEALAVAGGDARARDARGVEPLAYAVLSGATDCAKLLLDLGADPECVDEHGMPMLHLAAISGPSGHGLMAALRDAGAKLDALDAHGLTALHWTAVMGDPSAGKRLVALGADPSALDAFGRRPWETCGVKGAGFEESFKQLAEAPKARPILAGLAGHAR